MDTQLIRAIRAVAILSLATPGNAELDLNPLEGVYIGEATPFRCVRFRDGGVPVRFVPPEGWRFSADGARCVFHPAQLAQAGGTFSLSASSDVHGPARTEQLLREGMPADSKEVSFVLKGLPQVRLDRWKAEHSQASYEHFGQKFRIALVIVPMDGKELHVRFGARASDFDRVFSPLLESLGTFTWNPTDEDAPAVRSGVAGPKRGG